ncbi:hypothetical protein J6590_056723 [Homalodisca vitripennis]|nr:hypothetical protein J6590_056723 [Homalodisca vitripennis]
MLTTRRMYWLGQTGPAHQSVSVASQRMRSVEFVLLSRCQTQLPRATSTWQGGPTFPARLLLVYD